MKTAAKFPFQTSCLKLLVLVMILTFQSSVTADQNDPRLESLFEQLHLVSNQEAGNELTDQIWEIWREHPDEEVNELMRAGVMAMSTGQLSQLQRAAQIFEKIVDLDPQFAEGWNKRATVYFFLGQFEKSAEDVRQTLILEPRHFGATSGLGLIFLQLQYYQDALKAFERALEINPHLTGPKQQIRRLKEILKNDPV